MYLDLFLCDYLGFSVCVLLC